MVHAKRRKLNAEARPNFFAEVVGDDLAVHLMQLLKPRDALHLAKTCRRMAAVYSHKRCRLRRWKKFSHLFFQLECSKASTKALLISGNGTTDEEWDHVFKFSNAKRREAGIQIVLSNENTELAITTQRRRQWKQEDEEMGWNSDDEDPYYETTWTCYFRRGTRRGAFVLLAKFISEHFAFQDLRIEGLDKELSQALSKFRFYTKDYLKIEKAENFDGEDLLSWADMPHSRWLRFESTTPFSFKKTIFDDRRISCRESIDISVSEPNHGSCDVSNSELVELMTRRTHVKLQNIETEVMLGDLKAFINNWSSCGDDFSFSRWTFGIRLDAEDKSIGALYDNILEGHERTKSIN